MAKAKKEQPGPGGVETGAGLPTPSPNEKGAFAFLDQAMYSQRSEEMLDRKFRQRLRAAVTSTKIGHPAVKIFGELIGAPKTSLENAIHSMNRGHEVRYHPQNTGDAVEDETGSLATFGHLALGAVDLAMPKNPEIGRRFGGFARSALSTVAVLLKPLEFRSIWADKLLFEQGILDEEFLTSRVALTRRGGRGPTEYTPEVSWADLLEQVIFPRTMGEMVEVWTGPLTTINQSISVGSIANYSMPKRHKSIATFLYLLCHDVVEANQDLIPLKLVDLRPKKQPKTETKPEPEPTKPEPKPKPQGNKKPRHHHKKGKGKK